MPRTRTIVWISFLSLALLLPALVQRPHSIAQPPGAKQKDARERPQRELVGSPSCSASVCHGGSDIGQARSEATTFHALDPHARAYDALLTPVSQAIAKHLLGGTTPAHEAPLCLKCHVHPEYERARPNFRRQDGVGCESCHGAAQDWLTPHYRGSLSNVDKRSLGFADTKTLAGRANICVTCHVGTANASVDHDLIAAGHPPLRFEFATYLANLPPHWDVAKDKRATQDFEVRAWAIGQFVASASAFELLAHRAEHGKIWPEFAEFDCFSCHHDLAGGGWRQSPKHLGGRAPGSLAWSQWYHTMTPNMFPPKKGGFDFRKRPVNRDDLARHAQAAARRLHFEAETTQGDLDAAKFLKDAASRMAQAGTPDVWDEATQHYLGLMALQDALKGRQIDDIEVNNVVARMRGELTFRPGLNGPLRFVGPAPKIEDKKQ